jgi:hypothetical protein
MKRPIADRPRGAGCCEAGHRRLRRLAGWRILGRDKSPYLPRSYPPRAPFYASERLLISRTWRGNSMPPAKGRRRRARTRNRRLNRISLVIIGICAVIFIIFAFAGSHGTKPSSAQSTIAPTASAAASALATASTDQAGASQPPASTKPPSPAPARTTRPASPRPSTPKPASPRPSTPPPSSATAPTGCYPLSDENTCYEPGEYCRDDDHGTTGVAGDGKKIICEDNDGWRWEPY